MSKTIIQSICSNCENVFVQRRKGHRFCSHSCYKNWWYKQNKELCKTRAKKYYSKFKGRQNRLNVRIEVIDGYGGVCEDCGEYDLDVLTIDHVGGGGQEHRKQFRSNDQFYRWLRNNKFPSGFAVVCRNCNWKRHLRILRNG